MDMSTGEIQRIAITGASTEPDLDRNDEKPAKGFAELMKIKLWRREDVVCLSVVGTVPLNVQKEATTHHPSQPVKTGITLTDNIVPHPYIIRLVTKKVALFNAQICVALQRSNV